MFLMEDERTLTCAKACLDLAILYRDSKEAHEKLVANRGAAPAIELEKRTSYVYSERAKLLRTLISIGNNWSESLEPDEAQKKSKKCWTRIFLDYHPDKNKHLVDPIIKALIFTRCKELYDAWREDNALDVEPFNRALANNPLTDNEILQKIQEENDASEEEERTQQRSPEQETAPSPAKKKRKRHAATEDDSLVFLQGMFPTALPESVAQQDDYGNLNKKHKCFLNKYVVGQSPVTFIANYYQYAEEALAMEKTKMSPHDWLLYHLGEHRTQSKQKKRKLRFKIV